MCGIIGHIGVKSSLPILLSGLERLEYRGYDSSGVALKSDDSLAVYKKVGKVENLKNHLEELDVTDSFSGIAHTRWATHGEPSDINSHPHKSNDDSIALVHNGIIENYATLRTFLESKDFTFHSETDTEVIANLISYIRDAKKVSIIEAVKLATIELEGAYGVVLMSTEEPDKLFVLRKGSPIVIGVTDTDLYVASDVAAIAEYDPQVIYLEEGEVATLEKSGKYSVEGVNDDELAERLESIDFDLEQIEKGGYDSFMLKEIFEQPKSIKDCLAGRLDVENKAVKLGGIADYEVVMSKASRLIFVACGTSWHAALTGEYFIEELAGIPVEVEYASEFRYRNPIITKDDFVIAISQSGETADTLSALKLAKDKGATILGICNVVGSSIARLTDAGVYTHAGPEIGVASTKAFTAQLSVLMLLAIRLGELNGNLDRVKYDNIYAELSEIPQKITEALLIKESIFALSETMKDSSTVLYLGRRYNFPTALEGALKLKEISYIHAEGYPAAELKHGPIALVEKDLPVIFIATEGEILDKVISNMEEIKARKGRVIAIASSGNDSVGKITDEVYQVPETSEIFSPFTSTIPLQLLSYKIAVLRGCNVDKPRNLAKSVTVE